MVEQCIDIFTSKIERNEQLVKAMFNEILHVESNKQNTKRPRLKTEQMDDIARKADFMGGKFMLLYLSKAIVDNVFFQVHYVHLLRGLTSTFSLSNCWLMA